ncbi:hypothetical protein CDCA_CDCA08G2438 [Cyanidium caldarium]|uniref:Rab GDP dissociation inhibitor n=1 Tax=Cyanidium caldarium TaxID=2771 RepID=A0AAV9IVV3_CYACA|nr:hypothetical protein CDCA_CDCA08G2438 [Cyanidium caldarium]
MQPAEAALGQRAVQEELTSEAYHEALEAETSPPPPPPPPIPEPVIASDGVGDNTLADGTYDAVILGTGLTECILSGLLSKRGLRVLHVDRNPYYGGACASLDLTQMYERFTDGALIPAELGNPRAYNIDLVPKLIMATGQLVQILLHTDATKYLEFKLVDGSFVHTGDKPHKVPVTAMDALRSSLFSLLEKNRCRQFFSYINAYEPDDAATHNKLDLHKMSMRELYDYFGLQDTTRTLVGHALALYRNDAYVDAPALETVLRVKMYARGIARYGSSPYIYPQYGLGELPQAFARLSAVHGGVYMLNANIERVLFDESTGRVCGVCDADGRRATCHLVVGDPSYFPDRVTRTDAVVRCYCILRAPPEHTRESHSCQIILPHRQVRPPRAHDIYVLVLGHTHRVAAPGKYIALVSTTVETDAPAQEVEPGLRLLGGESNIVARFVTVDDVYEPVDDGRRDGVFVSKSYDATTHFETATADVLDLYARIFGEPLVLGGRT